MSDFKLMENHLKPRERILRGELAALSDSELLAVILGSGSKTTDVISLAHDLLYRSGGLVKLGSVSHQELVQFDGIGPSKAVAVEVVYELSKRITRQRMVSEQVNMDTPEAVFEYCQHLGYEVQEKVMLLSLNIHHELIAAHTIYSGLLSSVNIHPREVFKQVILDSAFGFVLIHNHPSGNSQPSDDDIIVTAQLVSASKLLSIPIIDHIIIGNQNFTSIRQQIPHIFDKENYK